MNPGRFDNLSAEDLIAREREVQQERRDLQDEIKRRLIAAAGIELGQVYLIADDGRSLAGRKIWVHAVNAGFRGLPGREVPYCFAWGRLNGKSRAGDGWTIRTQQVSVERLTRESAE